MLKVLVIQNRMVTYETFMDNLLDYELDLLCEQVKFAYKHEWEQTRYIVWSSLAPYMKGHKSPKDIFPLPTDEDEHNKEISNEDIERLKAKAAIYEQQTKT